MMKVKVEGQEHLVKDMDTGAVLNTDLSALQAYRQRRAAILKKNSEFTELQNEVAELKDLVNKLLTEKSK